MQYGIQVPTFAVAGSCQQPQTYGKPEAAITVFELLMMSGVSLETCWAIKKHWNNKFYYTVASCWFFLWDLYYDARINKHQVYPRTFGISVIEVRVLQNNSLKSRYKIGYKNKPIFAFPFEVFPFKLSYFTLICCSTSYVWNCHEELKSHIRAFKLFNQKMAFKFYFCLLSHA